MAKLFFSYSHKDETLRDELQTQLESLKRSGAIETWHDRMIPVGDELDGAINEKMEEADVILLLVSSDFLASKYCFDVEVKRAMERHEAGTARVIPVILRPCDWHHAPFAKLLAAPKDGREITMWPNRDQAFLDVVTQIRAALPDTALPGRSDVSVTVQPSAFTPRSSNLRLKKTFTDADKDRFMDDAFDYMAKFFEGSLDELQKRNQGIEGRFKHIDAHCFTAVIYQSGDSVARCAIRHGGSSRFESGIAYSQDDCGSGSSSRSFNEMLSLEVGEQALSLKSMGMSSYMSGGERESLSFEGAAELYWAKLIEPLQR